MTGADTEDPVGERHGSLRFRLTGAVMVPLAALVLLFGAITLYVTHDTEANTVDRVLIGSVRTLSLAYKSAPADRARVVPLTVRLLRRRARPVVHYSVYYDRRLLAGDPGLAPPADYRARWDGRVDPHAPATFVNAYRDTPMVRGYLDPEDAQDVTQAAYLRNGTLRGRPARIATEMRRVADYPGPIVIQVADFIDDREAYEHQFLVRVILYGLAVLAVSAVLFWWAIAWGLRPFFQLTEQVKEARHDPSPAFRLRMASSVPSEIVPFVAAFNGLMARLEQVARSLREFTTNASHQMRTPLAVARVHLDVLQRYGADSPEGRVALADIHGAVDTLERLLRQLIALARSEERPDEDPCPFDLAEVAATVTADRAAQAPDHIEISYDNRPGTPLRALGQPLLAAELIGNLVDNAIRYNRPGGAVRVAVYRAGDRVVVEVDDDGPGIPPPERERVWERFYRSAGHRSLSGSGLGLPIVRALAERMGAQVGLEDGRSGHGLCALVSFRAG